MDKDLKLSKEIENYLAGDMSPDEYLTFEKRLESDEAIRRELEITQRVIEGIKGVAFKKMLEDIHREHFGNDL